MKMKHGTYTSIDCPVKSSDEVFEEAFDFLKTKFGEIGATVRLVTNDHDLGSYESFEIDLPKKFKDLEILDSENENFERLMIEYEDWNALASAIEEEYAEKFEDYL